MKHLTIMSSNGVVTACGGSGGDSGESNTNTPVDVAGCGEHRGHRRLQLLKKSLSMVIFMVLPFSIKITH